MLFELRGVLQNALLGIGPVRHVLHKRLGKTGMNGDVAAAAARLDSYLRYLALDGRDVLELGPGHTPEVLLLAKERGARRCVGLDVERLTEPVGVRERGVELDLYDGGRMPYDDESFDIVWSSDVLEHVRDPERTLRECWRVLRPNGHFAAIVDLRDHYFLHIEEKWLHCLRYSEPLWLAMTSNRSSYVNRWRWSQWKDLFDRLDFTVRALDKQQSALLRRQNHEGTIRRRAGSMSDDDAATYRFEIFAEKLAK